MTAVRPLCEDDRHAVTRLLSASFGDTAEHDTAVARWLEGQGKAFVATVSGQVVGVASGHVAPACPWTAADFGEGVSRLASSSAFGVFDILAVSPAHRRDGLGFRLGRALEAWMVAEGVEWLLGVSWRHGERATSRGLFRADGFELLGVSEEFYGRMHASRPCPYCGAVCACVAELYGKAVRQGGADPQC